MSLRIKWLIIALVSAVAVGATVIVALVAWSDSRARQEAPSAVQTTTGGTAASGDRIVFRNTATGQGYGLVASVPLADPAGTRSLSDIACDRVAATASLTSCLLSERGITPTYTAKVYDASGVERSRSPLPGVPSRTRFSPDGSLLATTSFVSGHAYAAVGFSTATTITSVDGGADYGNLEDWTLLIDGVESAPVDRNYWGVTFIDDTTFYATVGLTTAGRTYLVQGDPAKKTMSTVIPDVECPSLSPDGTRIAFKRVTAGSGASVHWTPAVYDIASGEVSVLDAESRSIDDQIVWLDDSTLLYGMPGENPGDTDVWRLAADGSEKPTVFIAHAWSPTVVREGR